MRRVAGRRLSRAVGFACELLRRQGSSWSRAPRRTREARRDQLDASSTRSGRSRRATMPPRDCALGTRPDHPSEGPRDRRGRRRAEDMESRTRTIRRRSPPRRWSRGGRRRGRCPSRVRIAAQAGSLSRGCRQALGASWSIGGCAARGHDPTTHDGPGRLGRDGQQVLCRRGTIEQGSRPSTRRASRPTRPSATGD